MTDFEWPPDEIAGPPEENKPQGARGSTSAAGAPLAGVPMPVAGPQPGIPMAGPQQVGNDGAHTGPPQGLPAPPPSQQPAIPVSSAPIPVRPHAAPVPINQPSPPQANGAPLVRPQPAPPIAAPGSPVSPQSAPPAPAPGAPVQPVQPVSGSGRHTAPPPAPSAPPAPPRQVQVPTPHNPQGLPPAPPPQGPPSAPSAPRPAPPGVPVSPSQAPTGVFPIVQPQSPPPQPMPHSMPPSMPPAPAPTHAPSAPSAPQAHRPMPPTAPIPMNEEVYLPTAEEFARRRQVRPADPVAHMGIQAALRKTTFGLVNLGPGHREQNLRKQTDLVRRNFGGLRQITVVNPKGGAGKTCAVLLLAMTFGRKRGGYVLAWDNNETQGTLGMRSQQDFHSRTVRDLLRDLPQFRGVNSRVGDLSQYVRSQGDGMFEVLASDESATAGEMLTADAFAEIREVVSRFYKLIMVDTGNNVRAENWQAAIDATDQLVVTMSARNDSAETAARMLDHLEQTGRQRLVRQAVSIVSMPPSRKELDVPAIERHFAARTRAVLFAPYERMLDSGEPLDYARLTQESQDAWLAIAASVAEGL